MKKLKISSHYCTLHKYYFMYTCMAQPFNKRLHFLSTTFFVATVSMWQTYTDTIGDRKQTELSSQFVNKNMETLDAGEGQKMYPKAPRR